MSAGADFRKTANPFNFFVRKERNYIDFEKLIHMLNSTFKQIKIEFILS